MDRRFGSGGNRTAISNFPLIDVDHFLERRTVFVCHRQLVFERMLLFGGLRHFLPQPSEVLLDLLPFTVCFVLGLPERRDGGLGCANRVGILHLQVAYLAGQRRLLFQGTGEFGSRRHSVLDCRIVGTLHDAAPAGDHQR